MSDFNLEQAIARWRRQLTDAGLKSPEALDELEDHLRDEIERQLQSGATPRTAFETAAARMGEAPGLKAEFAKLNRTNAGRQRFLRAFYFGAVAFIALVNTWTLVAFETGPMEKAVGFPALSLVVLHLACLPHLLGSLSGRPYWRLVKAIKLASSLLWLWPTLALLQAVNLVNLQMGMIPSMILWYLCAAQGLSVVAYALHDLSRRDGGSGGPLPPFQLQPQPVPPTWPTPPEFGISIPAPQQFAPHAREALTAASEEAARLGHDFIGTEHVLLGVLKLAHGAFERVLAGLHLEPALVRVEIERFVPAQPAQAAAGTIPYTPRARKALRLAAREAKKLKQPRIGAEHIFLGLLLEGSGVAGRVLRKLGVNSVTLRAEIADRLRETQTG